MTLFKHLELADYKLPPQLRENLLTPALTIHLPLVQHNINCLIQALSGDVRRWRPHLKTTKIPEIYQMLCRAGVRHFKCATTREAHTVLHVLSDLQINDADLLVAHPLACSELKRLKQLAEKFPKTIVNVLCEDFETIDALGPSIGVFIDVNSGMNRSGMQLEDEQAIFSLARKSGDRFRGIHFYEGHIRNEEASTRRQLAFDGYARLICLLNNIRDEGLPCPEVLTSGTLSFLDAIAYGPFELLDGTTHRISPGTVIFHDAQSQRALQNLDLRPAALLRTRAVSQPTTDTITTNAGSKSIAAETGDPCCVALEYPDLTAMHPSEEHLPFRTAGEAPKRGELLSLIPEHICPTVNLAEEAVLIDENGSFSIASVSARAHEIMLTA